LQPRDRIRHQLAQAFLALDQRRRADRLAIEMEQIEQKEGERVGIAAIGRGLDQAEGVRSIRAHPAQLAVETSLRRRQGGQCRGNRRVFVCPIEPSAGQQPNRPSIQPGMQAIAVELDFMQPLRPDGRFFDQLRKLRLDPVRQTGRLASLPVR
jgi:hypothetical protein